ncbi:MAG: ATP-dependent 6-phosphofructokinase [Anaerolineaceae bacterium]|nr:ATP-dependent 6-phosphofructokinase [Anaerolineaceae bacterium]
MKINIGVLTAGGDSPGLNSAIRAIGKSAYQKFDAHVIGFLDGFRGLMQDRHVHLDSARLSGILTVGGTILGTSRDKPDRMMVGSKKLDMTDAMLEVYNKHHLDVLVCLGGGGTQKGAHTLMKKGMNIITLPKTIDNDIPETDQTFGFDTALGIATEAVDRLHSTAHSHHRIIVVEIMGHNTGWLALGAGVAGGADVILIPEIPYDVAKISDAVLARSRSGKRFSIIAVSEGAIAVNDLHAQMELISQKDQAMTKEERKQITDDLSQFKITQKENAFHLANLLEKSTGLESRVTILGHLQRGGAPSATDRMLATQLGAACIDCIDKGIYGVMVAIQGGYTKPVPLDDIVGRCKSVPLDHPWIKSARYVGTCLGD